MQYLAAYYWQSAKGNASSLVLQQAYHKKRKLPVLLACVCMDAPDKLVGRKLVTELADWFYEACLPMCSKAGERGMRSMNTSLKKCLRREKQKESECCMAGVFCMGNSVQIFQQGGMEIRLLNMRNHRSSSSALRITENGAQGLVLQNGILQPGVGILLATDSFYGHVSTEELEECLNIKELHTQSHLERRLRELGRLGEAGGGTDMGAILLTTK